MEPLHNALPRFPPVDVPETYDAAYAIAATNVNTTSGIKAVKITLHYTDASSEVMILVGMTLQFLEKNIGQS
ncbi:hypothetical protein [Clostridium cochlearium]|uniref:Uncharacterized protein n=1 Tax=Clostridium cochlearium TaxID=1494 RepID=A0A2X2VZF0_CLOCO|nr:hypothetical protein [Clostridium cochlearium]SQB34476.1 Uncharacterised protein [Clostridium cochlearium]